MQKRKQSYHKNMFALMIPSALALVICIVALSGFTYAWFTDRETSGNRRFCLEELPVAAVAMYCRAPEIEEVEETIEDGEEKPDEIALLEEKIEQLEGMTDDWIREEKADPLDGSFKLKPDTAYVMQFMYEDSADFEQPEECFLLLEVGGKKFYTSQIVMGSSLELLLAPADTERVLRYTPIAGKSEAQILDGFTLLESAADEDPMEMLQGTAAEEITLRLELLNEALEQAIKQEEKKQQEAAVPNGTTQSAEEPGENGTADSSTASVETAMSEAGAPENEAAEAVVSAEAAEVTEEPQEQAADDSQEEVTDGPKEEVTDTPQEMPPEAPDAESPGADVTE